MILRQEELTSLWIWDQGSRLLVWSRCYLRLIPGPIRKNLGCRPWDQLVELDYKNVATVINPLVYWLSFTDGLISLADPGSEVVSCGILTTITQVEIHGREWKCIVIFNKLPACVAQLLVEGQNFNKLKASSFKLQAWQWIKDNIGSNLDLVLWFSDL